MNRRSATLHDSLGRPLVLLPVLGAVVTFLVIFGISGALNCTSKVLPNASLNEPLELHAGNSSARCKQTATWAGFDEASNDLARDAREVFGLWRERGGFSRQHVDDALVECRKRLSPTGCTRFGVKNGTLLILNRTDHPFEQFWLDQLTYLNERHGLPEHLDIVLHFADEPEMTIADRDLAPVFATNAHVNNIDVAIPGFCRDQLDLTGSKAARARHPWSERKKKVLWRGTLTGSHIYPKTVEGWPRFPRAKLVNFTSAYPEYFDVKMAKDSNEEVSNEMAKYIPVTAIPMSREEQRTYRMILDIDGNGFSNRLRWMTKEDFLVFKIQTPYSEYFTKYFRDSEHLYEVKADFSDLVEKVKYAMEHEEKSLAIVEAAARQNHLYLGRGMWEFYSLALLQEYMKLFNRAS